MLVAEGQPLVALGTSRLRLALEHDPEKHALGLRPDGWKPVFHRDKRQRVCAEIILK
jgi:hypothetical protein